VAAVPPLRCSKDEPAEAAVEPDANEEPAVDTPERVPIVAAPGRRKEPAFEDDNVEDLTRNPEWTKVVTSSGLKSIAFEGVRRHRRYFSAS